MKIKKLKLFKDVKQTKLNTIYRLYMLNHRNTFYLNNVEDIKVLEKDFMKG